MEPAFSVIIGVSIVFLGLGIGALVVWLVDRVDRNKHNKVEVSKEKQKEFYRVRNDLTLYWHIQDGTGKLRGPITKHTALSAGWTLFGIRADTLGRAEWANNNKGVK